LALASDIVVGSSLAVAGYAHRSITSAPPPAPYVINDVTCVLQSEKQDLHIIATVTVSVTGKQPWLFVDNDFNMLVGANRIPSDLPPKRRVPKWSDPSRIASTILQHPAVSALHSSTDLLVEPSRSAVLRLDAIAPESVVEFLSAHKQHQRCTVFDANDNPVGRIGPLFAQQNK
jgi:hypothetical protein